MDNFYEQITESLNSAFKLTSRIEERVKVVVESQKELKNDIYKLQERYSDLRSKLTILENKNGGELKEKIKEINKEVNDLQQKFKVLDLLTSMNTSKWASVVDFIFKIGVVVIGAAVIYYLGIR